MPNWIGDLILGLSVVLRKSDPGGAGNGAVEPISLIVPERLAGLAGVLCDLPVIPYRRKSRREFFVSAREVAAHSFEKLYLLPHSFSSALFAFLTRIDGAGSLSSCAGVF